MTAINPVIVDIDESTPMSKEELKMLEACEQLIKDNWIDRDQFKYDIGKKLHRVREIGHWKYDEIFKIKTGKNKGTLKKNPKFDRYLEEYSDTKFGAWAKELKEALKAYEGHLLHKKYHEEQLEKFHRIERSNAS
jgi:hypothetical protein